MKMRERKELDETWLVDLEYIHWNRLQQHSPKVMSRSREMSTTKLT